MKFKKLTSVLLGLAMSLSLSVTAFADTSSKSVNNKVQTVSTSSNTVELKEGEHVQIPIKAETKGDFSTDSVFRGASGYVDISHSGNRVNYKIVMKQACTSFVGYLQITDVTSQNTAGFSVVSGFEDYATYTVRSGHKYSASVHGTAFNGTKAVATTVDNYIAWYC